MNEVEIRRLQIRAEAQRTLETGAYRGYVEYCEKIGIAPKSLEQWREDCRRAFAVRGDDVQR
jgi:hypothetical protein